MCRKLAIDVGANIGTKTVELLEQGFDRVIAVEPLYDSPFPESEKRVIWIKSLVSNSLETKMIYPLGTISTTETEFMSGRFKGAPWGAPVSCKATTLFHLFQEYGIPDYIKIDVEGSELAVIQGMPTKGTYWPGLSFEWSSEFREEAEKCVTELANRGYARFALQFEDRLIDIATVDWVDQVGLWADFDRMCAERVLPWGMLHASI